MLHKNLETGDRSVSLHLCPLQSVFRNSDLGIPNKILSFAVLLACLIVMYAAITIISLAGNFLVVWVVKTTRSLQTGINGFIANLAVSDITLSLFCTPFQFYAAFKQRWDLPVFMCKFCPFAQTCSVNVSVFTLVAISHDRYMAIMNPMGKKTSSGKAKVIVIYIWMGSIALALPAAYFHKFAYINEGSDPLTGNKPFCALDTYHVLPQKLSNGTYYEWEGENTKFKPSQVYQIIVAVLQYGAPFIAMIFQYSKMIQIMCARKVPGNTNEERDLTIQKSRDKSVKMMIAVVVLFGMCWFPWHFYHVMSNLSSLFAYFE